MVGDACDSGHCILLVYQSSLLLFMYHHHHHRSSSSCAHPQPSLSSSSSTIYQQQCMVNTGSRDNTTPSPSNNHVSITPKTTGHAQYKKPCTKNKPVMYSGNHRHKANLIHWIRVTHTSYNTLWYTLPDWQHCTSPPGCMYCVCVVYVLTWLHV